MTGQSGDNLRSEIQKLESLLASNQTTYVILTEDGIVQDAGSGYAQLCGCSQPADLIGRSITEWTALQELPGLKWALETCRRDGSIRNFDTAIVDPDGHQTPIRIDAAFDRAYHPPQIRALCRIGHSLTESASHPAQEQVVAAAMFENAPFLMYEYDEQLRMVRWNKQVERQSRFTPAELHHKSLFSWFAEDETPAVAAELKNLRETGYATLEANLVMKDGSRIPYYLTALSLMVDHKSYFAGIGIDLSAQKRANEEIRASELRLRRFIEEAPIPIGVGRNGIMIYANSAYLKMAGAQSVDQLVGRPILDRFAPECREMVAGYQRNRALGLPAPSEYEAVSLRINGTRFPIYVRVASLELADGPVLLAFVSDMTARKEAEEAVKRERDRAERYLQVAEVMLAAIDRAGTILMVNRKGCEILGYTESELVGRNWFDQCLLPDESDKVRRVSQTILSGDIRSVEYFENHIVRKDGQARLIAWHNAYLQDSAGQITGILSSGQDITDRKRAEAALSASESRYRRLHTSMMDGFVLVDMQGNIREFNDSYRAMLGYTVGEMADKTYELITPVKWHTFEQSIVNTQILTRGYSDVYEKEYLRKDGTIIPVELRTFLLRNEQGVPEGMWAVVRDISERKRAQDEISQMNEALRLERETLEHKNIALQELLAQVGEGRKAIGTQIQSNIETIVLPILDRLALKLDPQGKSFLALARSSLSDIVTPSITSKEQWSHKLTPQEIELCEFIRRGLGSKEIAALRGCSVQTVIKRRKIVRKKLGITGKDVNLASYLGSILAGSAPSPSSDDN